MDLQIDKAACRAERTYGPGTLWVVVIAVNRKHGQGDVQIRIFVIDRGETCGLRLTFASISVNYTVEWWRDLRSAGNFALIGITQKLDLNWSVT